MTYTATLSNSSTITATATFNVSSPNLYSYSSTTSGISCCTSDLSFGIGYAAEVITGSNEAGIVAYLQTVTVDRTKTQSGSTVVESSSSPVLDNPPSGAVVFQQASFPASADGTISGNDAPSLPTSSLLTHISMADSFKTYVMYMPSGTGSVWVTLGVLTWNYSAGATNNGSGGWTLDSGSSSSTNPSGSGSTALPVWTDYATDLSYH